MTSVMRPDPRYELAWVPQLIAVGRQRYRDCVNELLSKCRKHTKCIEDVFVKSENMGAFYKYINKRTSYRPAIGALTDEMTVEITKPTIMIKQNYSIVILLQSVW